MTPEIARKRLFVYVVDRLGRAEAAKRLDTSPASLDAWMSGRDVPSTQSLSALADLVYEMQKAEMPK